MYATNYYETLILNAMRGQSASPPPNLYLALYLNNPGETGQAGTEVTYPGYARQQVTFSAPAPMYTGIGLTNSYDITFPIAPVSIGTATHIGLLDSLTGGNMLLYGQPDEGITVDANEAPTIIAGEVEWWIIGNMSTAYRAQVLNFLRGQQLTGFTSYLALFNGAPEDGGSELSGENYERRAMAFSAPEEQAGGQMKISVSEAINFNRPTASWGTLTHMAVYNGQTAGNPIYVLERQPNKALTRGVMITVRPGDLYFTVN